MNEAEKNKRIAELVYPDFLIGMPNANGSIPIIDTTSVHNFPDLVVDYYNNWSDLMPLVDKHGIGFEKVCFGEDTPYFVARGVLAMVGNKNLQHALADCLLKVLEEKSDG